MFSDFSFDFAELSDYLFLHCVLQNPPFCIVNAVTEKRVKTTDSDRTGASMRLACNTPINYKNTSHDGEWRVKSKETVGNSWSF